MSSGKLNSGFHGFALFNGIEQTLGEIVLLARRWFAQTTIDVVQGLSGIKQTLLQGLFDVSLPATLMVRLFLFFSNYHTGKDVVCQVML